MAEYLVTGGAGFIGSNIVEELLRKKHAVIVLDNLSTGSLDNIKPFLKRIKFIRGDLRNMRDVRIATKGVQYVLHQAALRSVERSVNDPKATNDSNITGTLNLLIAASEHKVKRLVYASSSSVYGDSKKLPQREDHLPAPVSPYAVSKLTGEYYCRVFAKTFGLETVSLRYFNVFGPRQNPRSKYAAVIPIFMECALQGKPLPIHGDGRQSRDFTYIANVVHANILASQTSGISGEVFNVALGNSNNLLDIVSLLEEILNKKLPRNHLPPRLGDVRRTCAYNRKIVSKLGFKPKVLFKEGILKTWKWLSNEWCGYIR
ncbi:MAG: SDR family oxidoreductase [bacterium]